MSQSAFPRRDFLKTGTAVAATAALPYWWTPSLRADETSPSERPVIGSIGLGGRGRTVMGNAMNFGSVAAVCDLDSGRLGKTREDVEGRQKGATVEGVADYRKILDRSDIDIVTIGTTDHWHTKIAVEALKAGKDVYCEKPLTLTIEEGTLIEKALAETGRVFQVGTQQRSEMGQRFLEAIAIVRAGRIGEVKRVTCTIGSVRDSGPIPAVEAPAELNWEKWLGQAPLTEFRLKEQFRQTDKGPKKTRPLTNGHYEFRWWYEYSGGKMTDWGAHHVDIAQWLIDQNGPGQGPTRLEPLEAVHAVDLDDHGQPLQNDRYNAALKFRVKADFPNGVEMLIHSNGRNGILVEGTEGRIFVNRGSISGQAVDELKTNPLPEGAIADVYGGTNPADYGKSPHMANFIECVKTRSKPVSDVWTHNRAINTCHLANIAVRLNRTIQWDAEQGRVVGDEVADSMRSRERRAGYEIEV
ncbi:Gfo/Idh/MocA family protein [Stratiformator vulcanicus]|uniref:Inositol 2-dehydrogenase n=1 Tax=Stratiformator vulcanicus TaxID=2527980 RepID=A0A517R684_9PLAN|nr:Gfo/Idh/MocA family oxidoreductase [Stratiformator vulcanicus]QDT39355.1 Inositol 2-dehydrogenase [Stratiformator vulcanicus]